MKNNNDVNVDILEKVTTGKLVGFYLKDLIANAIVGLLLFCGWWGFLT